MKLLIALAIPQLAGIIGSLFTRDAITEWYAYLVRPSFAPPSWVFAPVWTTLYLLMGIAAYLVWRKVGTVKGVGLALSLFVFQLVLNTLWSVIFFGLRAPGAAFAELVFLWLMIVATMVAFYRVSRTAMWLLVPYLLWVSFAGYLNYAFWTLN